jgi:hypothetical protein
MQKIVQQINVRFVISDFSITRKVKKNINPVAKNHSVVYYEENY